ncbi:MAG: MarR family transcriptional regulator [Proteobacteria bacterium]|nr:MarR family transcriptional regulator [Pseudomonadota bacterium]
MAAAAAALARLDAQAEAASPAVQQGLIARLIYAEAAGWLASQGITAHPVSLALRDRERVGRRELWLQHKALRRTTPAWEEDDVWLAADEKIGRALTTLARLLERVPSADNPLIDHAHAEAWLGPLAPQACPFDTHRFTTWRSAHMPDGRRPDPRPALLRAADAALDWMEGGISDEPDAIQALAIAVLLLKRMGAVDIVPPRFWTAWSALCAPDDPGVLPRLRGDTAARLAPDGTASWPLVFLHLIAKSARAGSRIVFELRVTEAAGLAFAAGEDKRSRLPATVDLLLRQPALTAPALARRLDITPQAALRLFARLEQAGLVQEVTGRDSFRAFALAVRPSGRPRLEGR